MNADFDSVPDDLVLYAIPAFILLLVAEALYARRAGTGWYRTPDTFASLAMGIGNVVIDIALKGLTVGGYFWLYQYRIFEIGTQWWAFALLFVCEDFCYYWFHRLHHTVRVLWAAHVNHHSSEKYNLATALRQSWTTPITKFLFWVPLPLLGFHPTMILFQMAVSLLYQFWIHTESIGRLGPFEWVFNTPSHHRVHHGSDLKYLDRNHGGILIVWDRLFGTFQVEEEAPNYGLISNIKTYNPVRIAFHEFADIVRDLAGTRNPAHWFMFTFGPPGWSPDGSKLTVAQLRAQAAAEQVSDPAP